MKRLLSLSIILLVWTTVTTAQEGIFAVISARVTANDRPLLWLNRDSDNNGSRLHYFSGQEYNFIGLVKGDDTTGVITGQNTSGFALVYTTAMDIPSNLNADVPALIKSALGVCATVQQFLELLAKSPVSNAIFGCIDHYGKCMIIEQDTSQIVRYNVDDAAIAPQGFLVRHNFTMLGKAPVPGNTWRYHRVTELLGKATPGTLDAKTVLKFVARDVHSQDLDPYPLPFTGRYKNAPKHLVPALETINNIYTTNCLVYFGVSQLNERELPGLLYIPGQPLCGAAVPLWPHSGDIPTALSGRGFTKIAYAINAIADNIYRKRAWPGYFDSKMLTRGKSRLRQNLNAEAEMLDGIYPLQVNNLEDLSKLQNQWANQILRALQ